MKNEISVPNLSEAINFVIKLNNKYLLFNIYSTSLTILIIILISILIKVFIVRMLLYLIVLIVANMLSKIKKKIHGIQHIMKLIDADIKIKKLHYTMGYLVMGIYFLSLHEGFKYTDTFEKKHALQHHLIKNYIDLMDMEFIISHVKLIRDFVLSDYDKEFNNIVANYVFKKIQEHERFRENNDPDHLFAITLIQEHSNWFDSISIPITQREYYQKIQQQSL